MYDGYFVFDCVVHMFDNRPQNKNGEIGDELAKAVIGAGNLFSRGEYAAAPMSMANDTPSIEEASKLLFVESSTDMAIAQTVPLFGWFEDGFAPAARNYELAKANPGKVVFCGGVDPLHKGLNDALANMEFQVNEYGAIGFKFYQGRSDGTYWRADDRDIAYKMYEKALDLGVNNVQFHKGLPFGRRQQLDPLRPNDLEIAARDFPELNFVIHHLGEPYLDETTNIAARHPNIWVALSAWINMYPIMPRKCIKRLGELLFYVGPDRLLYGSEAFVWPRVEPYIKLFAEMEMPEDLQDGYGYPALTREIKRKIFGENLARLLDIDISSVASASKPLAARA